MLTHGISAFQKMYILAIVSYPFAYMVAITVSHHYAKRQNMEHSIRVMSYNFLYLIGLLGLWPALVS